MTRYLQRSAVIAAALAMALALQLAGPRPADAQTAALTVPAGSGEPGYAVNLFGAPKVTVASGATLTFKNNWIEPHTVTFLGGTTTKLPTPGDPSAPVPTDPGKTVPADGSKYVSSGFITQGQSFSVTLPTKGSYTFYCIIHPGMQGSVDVVDAGNAAISTQAAVDTTSAKTFGDATVALKAAAADLTAKGVAKTANADGTSTWTVTVGGTVGTSDLQQFFLPKLDIKVGDTIVWKSSVGTPHTATFLGGTALPIPPSPDNPKVLLPTPAPATGYTGTGFESSGILGLGWPAQQFSTKFTTAGSFPFICILHVDQGMGGIVNVAAAQITPAATGSAGLEGAATPASRALQALLALGALALVAGARWAASAARAR